MGTRSRIEWFCGTKLGYETADELGLAQFTKSVRPRATRDYLWYAREKVRRKQNSVAIHRLAKATGNKALWHSWMQRRNCMKRNRFWRALGYPNLRRAWQVRRENCARRRAIKELAAIQEKQRKYLEQFGYERP